MLLSLDWWGRKYRAPEDESGGDGGGVAVSDEPGGEGGAEEQPSEYLEEEPDQTFLDEGAPEGEPGAKPGEEPEGGEGAAQFDHTHYQWAAHFGISPQQLQEQYSVESFEQFVRPFAETYHRQAAAEQHAREQAQQQAHQQAYQQRQTPPELVGNFELENPEEFIGALDEHFPKYNEHINSRFQQTETILRGLVNEVLQQRQYYQQQQEIYAQQQQQAAEQEFHSVLDEMDESLFGRGVDLEPAAAANRQQVGQQVWILQQGYLNAGVPIPPLRELVEQSRAMLFQDSLTNEKLRAASASSRRLSRQAGAVPAGERGHLSPEQRAAKAAADFMRERKMGEFDDMEADQPVGL